MMSGSFLDSDFWSFLHGYPREGAYGYPKLDTPPYDSALFNAFDFDSVDAPASTVYPGLRAQLPFPGSRCPQFHLEPLAFDAYPTGRYSATTDDLAFGFSRTTSLDKTVVPQGAFDPFAHDLGRPSAPSSPMQETSLTIRLGQFHIDQKHDYAEGAIRARHVRMQLKEEPCLPKYISPKFLIQSTGLPTSPKSERPLKRRLFPEEAPTSRSAPVTPLAHHSRALAPLPRRARKGTPAPADAGKLSPLQTPIAPPPSRAHSASASSSSTPSTSFSPLSLESDDDCDADDEYSPGSKGRGKKRQKTSSSPSRSPSRSTSKAPKAPKARPFGQTQFARVLESLPPQCRDIKEENGVVYCPFPGCFHTADSYGDLGRHFESDIHATHKFICLDPSCLHEFAREDSMKRHHNNHRGKQHKATHDRMVKMGFDIRIRRDQVDDIGRQIRALVGAPRTI